MLRSMRVIYADCYLKTILDLKVILRAILVKEMLILINKRYKPYEKIKKTNLTISKTNMHWVFCS